MKALVVLLIFVVARDVAGGAVAWPGAALALSTPLVNTVLHPATKGFSYSTTQYINALPASYPYGIRPQFAYQIPQITAFAPLPGLPTYYPIGSASYIPTGSAIYPQLSPFAPGQPQQPISSVPSIPSSPNAPEQPNNQPSLPPQQQDGDADTTVIDSAEFLNQQQDQQRTSNSDGSVQPQLSTSGIPDQQQQPQFASFSPFLQWPQGIPQYPQFPQLPTIPQFPSAPGSLPLFPQLPSIPHFPSSEVASSSPQVPELPSIPQPPTKEDSSSSQQPQLPSTPQLPPKQEDLPQLPPKQESSSQPPQLPPIPQFPPTQGGSNPPSFPSADNSNKGLNDEDTISVESA